MGEVYRATDEATGTVVALKRLHATKDPESDLETSMFEREYHALSELRHPCIVRVMDYGVESDGAYYTMELLDGQDLRDGGTLPWRRVCQILRDVASAAAILHSRKVLHGDLSTRNVRCTSSGRAKLIDFGTMTPMGVAKSVAGTPPFLAPEVFKRLALDARTDLFSIGAIGYWMLTGRHAYAARSLHQLPQMWAGIVVEPRELSGDVPKALNDLIMELLRLDRMARPANAAVVMERLCSIADLPLGEREEVTQAYLAIPALVGRKRELERVRSLLARKRGDAAVVITGDPGVGRSRFLDACILEATLLGKSVIRVNAEESTRKEYGAVQLLAEQLLREAPELVRKAARSWQDVLAHVVPDLDGSREGAAPPERRHLQSALRAWFIAVAKQKPLVLAIDDFEDIDEPSAAVVAGLAHVTSRRDLAVIATMQPGASAAAAKVLKETPDEIHLDALSREQTEALMRSVFGDADNVVGVAHHLHELSGGRPREALDLAQHLVDRGLAQYSAGSWVLPRRLTAENLRQLVPAGRLSELSAPARQLGEALSLTNPAEIPAAVFAALLDSDAATAYRAAGELVSAGVVTPTARGHRFTHQGWKKALASSIDGDRRRLLHSRLAKIIEQRDPVARARHLLEAGDVADAIQVVLQQRRGFGHHPETPSLIDRILEASEALEVPRADRISMEITLVNCAAFFGSVEPFWRHAPGLLAQLKHDSGLDDWMALEERGVPESERLMQAFGRVEQRFAETPEADRGLPIQAAIKHLARVCSAFSNMASLSMDPRPLFDAPSFEPFYVLAPPLAVLDRSLNAARGFLTTHNVRARSEALAVVDLLDKPDHSGVDQSIARSLRFAMLYMVGAMDAFDGLPDATEHVSAFENVPGFRGNAWRVRRVAHLMQGDVNEAEKCQRRAEQLELLDGEEQAFGGTAIRLEAAAHWMVGDLVRLKESVERIAELSELFPGWRNTLAMARSHYKRLQGDGHGALEAILPALQNCGPGKDPDWPWVAAAHVHALVACGRHAEAAEVGEDYYAAGHREELFPAVRCLVQPLCQAYLENGQTGAALKLIEGAIAELESQNVRGLWMGGFYEARAYVAISMEDQTAFERYAALCAEEYKRAKNSMLVANYERLVETARRRSLGVSTSLERAADPSEDSTYSSMAATTVRGLLSRVRECTTSAERARCALAAICEETGAAAGHLFGVRDRVLVHLASSPKDLAISSTLVPALQQYLSECTIEDVTQSAAVDVEGAPLPVVGSPGRGFDSSLRPSLVFAHHDGGLAVVAVAALRYESEARSGSTEVMHAVGQLLVSHEDVEPIPLVG